MKSIAVTVLFVLSAVSMASAAGLGDTVADIEKAWKRGYREEYPAGLGSKAVSIGASKRNSFQYITGVVGSSFGRPERIGRLEGEASQLFGVSKQIFYKGIRKLFPRDYKPITCYTKTGEWVEEICTFQAKSLAKIPGISQSLAYSADGMNHPLGTFSIIINHDIADKNKVANFTLFLGLPVEVDLVGMRKVGARNF